MSGKIRQRFHIIDGIEVEDGQHFTGERERERERDRKSKMMKQQ
jgi:hypothetical protein